MKGAYCFLLLAAVLVHITGCENKLNQQNNILAAENNSKDQLDILAVKGKYEDELMAIPGVLGVGSVNVMQRTALLYLSRIALRR